MTNVELEERIRALEQRDEYYQAQFRELHQILDKYKEQEKMKKIYELRDQLW